MRTYIITALVLNAAQANGDEPYGDENREQIGQDTFSARTVGEAIYNAKQWMIENIDTSIYTFYETDDAITIYRDGKIYAVYSDFRGKIPNKNRRTEHIYMCITPELKEKLQEAADNDHRTVSNYIEKIITEKLG